MEAFSNQQVFLHSIGQVQHLEPTFLSPKYLIANRVLTILFFVFVLSVMTVASWQPWFNLPIFYQENTVYFALLVFVLFLLEFAHVYFGDPKKHYAVRQHDLSYTSGLFFVSTVCQPILRMQHVELKRGPIERWLGLATLQVFSAGGSSHTFEIPGLTVDTAQELRQYILDYNRGAPSASK